MCLLWELCLNYIISEAVCSHLNAHDENSDEIDPLFYLLAEWCQIYQSYLAFPIEPLKYILFYIPFMKYSLPHSHKRYEKRRENKTKLLTTI